MVTERAKRWKRRVLRSGTADIKGHEHNAIVGELYDRINTLEQERETDRRASKVELNRLNEVVADYIQTIERLRAEIRQMKETAEAGSRVARDPRIFDSIARQADRALTKPKGE